LSTQVRRQLQIYTMREAVRLADSLCLPFHERRLSGFLPAPKNVCFHSYWGQPAIAGNSLDEGNKRPGAPPTVAVFSCLQAGSEQKRLKQSWKRCAMWRRGLALCGWCCWPQRGERGEASSGEFARNGRGIEPQRNPCRRGSSSCAWKKRRVALRSRANFDTARQRDCRVACACQLSPQGAGRRLPRSPRLVWY